MNCGANPEVCAVGARKTQDDLMLVLRDGRFWFFILIVLFVALIGSAIVANGMDSFNQLNRPSWMPPNVVFTVVWIILYFIIAYTCFRAVSDTIAPYSTAIYILFIINMVLQLVWLYTFFKTNNMNASLIVMAFLLLSAIILFIVMWMVNPFYAFILLLYVIWLFVALGLNIQMNSLNPVPDCSSESTESCTEESHHDLPSTESGDCKNETEIEEIELKRDFNS